MPPAKIKRTERDKTVSTIIDISREGLRPWPRRTQRYESTVRM
jgi:hypothetical protein